MATSQKQIAEKLGVSIALVSRVLSGRAAEIGIAADTIDRVLLAAAEMGYVPNAAALTLKGKSSRTIGVVVYDFNDPFFGASIEQLQAQAHEQGYSLVLAGFKGRHPEESDLAPLHKHAIDGLIVLGSDDQAGWLGAFGHLPVARIGHGSPAEQSVRVTVDEDDAARQLLAHLAHGTPQRFGFLGEHLTAHVLRFQALEKRVSGASPILSARYSMASGFEAGLQAAKQLLAEPLEYDAFICATDLIAMGALRALHDTGRHMAVTGFDDIPAAAQFIPPLTTIRQPLEDMAERAIAAVIESAAPSEIVLPGNLIIRSTS